MKKIAISLLMAAVISLSACTVSPETEVPASTKVTTISEVTAETTSITEEASSIGNAETQAETVTSAKETVTSNSESVTTTASTTISKAETTTQTSSSKVNTEKMYVHFIDVGQGDSIFIELPNGESMLIDAAEEEQADKIITYIHQQGYDSLDYVVETHPHSDHMGGMADVINNFNVSNVYLSPATNTTKAYENMLTAIKSSDAKTYSPMAGDTILNDGNLLIEVVAPKAVNNDELNNSSLVIKLTYGEKKFLFAGDAEKDEEDGIWTNIKCDVLKVGHHGSDSSTTANFLKKVEPTYAIISVGTGNSYGHPTDATLKRLSDKGMKTYRTDLQGTIVFTSDGKSISVDKSPSEYKAPAATTIAATTTVAVTTSGSNYKYILNTKTKKIHYANCSSVDDMNEENKAFINNYDKAIADGYVLCKRCNPVG